MKTMSYKGYDGSIQYNEEYQEYYGRILNIGDYVDYISAKDLIELETYFHQAVDDYILSLKENTPLNKSF